ncbi:hypothetical protein CPB84DRAFT_1751170 [Gymnopilus junonius]|uniref:Uncharacterized protein n=1 Tax=Gymnopilus junonius TaxID=109634 RepID=A0A9P5NEI0_GYMJU|nr:hypothetical protein CPB84DRAFT_1751170 [Gymnopilus junonius]
MWKWACPSWLVNHCSCLTLIPPFMAWKLHPVHNPPLFKATLHSLIPLQRGQGIRAANRQLITEAEQQRLILSDQQTCLIETMSKQQAILQEFCKMQQQIAEECKSFQEMLAQTEREKADSNEALLKEIQAVKAAKEMEVAAVVQRTKRAEKQP